MPTTVISVTSAGQQRALAVAAGDEVGDRGDAVAARDADHLAQHQPGQHHRQRRAEVDRQEPHARRRRRGRRCRSRSRRCSTPPSTAHRPRRCRSPSGPLRARRSPKRGHGEQQQQVGERGADDERGGQHGVQAYSSPGASAIQAASADQQRPDRRTAPAGTAAGRTRVRVAVPQRQQRKVQQQRQPAANSASRRCVAQASDRSCSFTLPSQRIEPEVQPQMLPEALDDRQRVLQRSRSSVPSSDGAPGCSAASPGARWRRLFRASAPSGSAAPRSGRGQSGARRCSRSTSARRRSAVPSSRTPVLQRQRAHAVHDREGAELLQVDSGCSSLAQPVSRVPPAARLVELVGRAGEAREEGVAVGQDAVEVPRTSSQQRGVAGHRGGVDRRSPGASAHRARRRRSSSRSVSLNAATGWRHSGWLSMMCPGHGG